MAIIEAVANAGRRADAVELLDIMKEATGHQAMAWDGNTIGFGRYHYRYATGQEGDFFQVGFAPRRDRITLYIMSGLHGFDDVLERLGKHTASKSTVHFTRLADLDRAALVDLIVECVAHLDRVEGELGAIPRMSEIPAREA